MKSQNIEKLKAAVAQFNEAFESINDCLHKALEETNDRAHHLDAAIGCIADEATVDRLNYEIGVVYEDQSSLQSAWRAWQSIAGEYNHHFWTISDKIDEAAGDALSYEDFTANDARFREIQAQRRREDIRPMTHEEMECLCRKDLSAYAFLKLGITYKGELKSDISAERYSAEMNGEAIIITKMHNGTWRWLRPNGAGGSIWHLEAAVKQIPTHEALTNVRLHFGTEWMSARKGDTPSLEGLTYHWSREASKRIAAHDNEAIWAQRLKEAADGGERFRIVGNPDDLQPIVIKEFCPIHPANLPAGAFGGIFTDRRAL